MINCPDCGVNLNAELRCSECGKHFEPSETYEQRTMRLAAEALDARAPYRKTLEKIFLISDPRRSCPIIERQLGIDRRFNVEVTGCFQ